MKEKFLKVLEDGKRKTSSKQRENIFLSWKIDFHSVNKKRFE